VGHKCPSLALSRYSKGQEFKMLQADVELVTERIAELTKEIVGDRVCVFDVH
jgi:hypothetical protein